MDIDFNYSRIADPVHATIGLSKIENRVLGSQAFIRLHGVKQLGMAFQIYPGAGYSRFSHGVGACHVMGRILEAVRATGEVIGDEEVQRYRLAALLHDVGHYPFSHSTEDAIADYYTSTNLLQGEDDTSGDVSSKSDEKLFYRHESLGKQILMGDDELNSILKEEGFDPEDIYRIFNREDPPRFANLISSDLDADRLDYLMRTAHNTGLPYGNTDLEYLLTQTVLDKDSKLCLTPKAIRTAEHFLLSRYFDYQQVAFHKTVAGMEMVLKDVMRVLLHDKVLDCSAASMEKMITSGAWRQFDDGAVIQSIRSHRSDVDTQDKYKFGALLDRKPPKLLCSVESIENRGDDRLKPLQFSWNSSIDGWKAKFEIPQFYIWRNDMEMTKVGSSMAVSAATEEEADTDSYEQSVRIRTADGGSIPINEANGSLMNSLSNRQLQMVRIYAVFPDGNESARAELTNEVTALTRDLGFEPSM